MCAHLQLLHSDDQTCINLLDNCASEQWMIASPLYECLSFLFMLFAKVNSHFFWRLVCTNGDFCVQQRNSIENNQDFRCCINVEINSWEQECAFSSENYEQNMILAECICANSVLQDANSLGRISSVFI